MWTCSFTTITTLRVGARRSLTGRIERPSLRSFCTKAHDIVRSWKLIVRKSCCWLRIFRTFFCVTRRRSEVRWKRTNGWALLRWSSSPPKPPTKSWTLCSTCLHRRFSTTSKFTTSPLTPCRRPS
uniref:(northern house mosquito) hypothetical protein n=1 Tax=Culex pipiens TaxID=7175 RepID=A0A8D8FCN7_CULPI